MKKSESEDESEQKAEIERLAKANVAAEKMAAISLELIEKLEERVKALEKALIHAQHTNTEDGSRHQNDGGWFD